MTKRTNANYDLGALGAFPEGGKAEWMDPFASFLDFAVKSNEGWSPKRQHNLLPALEEFLGWSSEHSGSK